MSDKRYYESEKERGRRPGKKMNLWLVVGVIVLVALLIIWLTEADIFGDTDVAAYINNFGL